MSGIGLVPTDDSFRADGLRFHYRAWSPADPVAALLIVHGFAEHGGRYDGVARALAEHQISTWALDQRGHGLSGGRRGHARRFDCFLQDLDRFRREVQDRIEPGLPLFLLGHSMGGLVALLYLEEYSESFAGAVIVSPWLATVAHVPPWKTALAALLTRLGPALPFRAGVPAEFLSHDAAVVQAYRDDPLVHNRITPRLFSEISAAMDHTFRGADRIRLPLLFLLAGADRIVDTERSLAFGRSVPGAEVRVLDGMYHEILNEPEGPRHVARIAAWMRARVGAQPGKGVQ